jgi:hypothetical protein
MKTDTDTGLPGYSGVIPAASSLPPVKVIDYTGIIGAGTAGSHEIQGFTE